MMSENTPLETCPLCSTPERVSTLSCRRGFVRCSRLECPYSPLLFPNVDRKNITKYKKQLTNQCDEKTASTSNHVNLVEQKSTISGASQESASELKCTSSTAAPADPESIAKKQSPVSSCTKAASALECKSSFPVCEETKDKEKCRVSSVNKSSISVCKETKDNQKCTVFSSKETKDNEKCTVSNVNKSSIPVCEETKDNEKCTASNSKETKDNEKCTVSNVNKSSIPVCKETKDNEKCTVSSVNKSSIPVCKKTKDSEKCTVFNVSKSFECKVIPKCSSRVLTPVCKATGVKQNSLTISNKPQVPAHSTVVAADLESIAKQQPRISSFTEVGLALECKSSNLVCEETKDNKKCAVSNLVCEETKDNKKCAVSNLVCEETKDNKKCAVSNVNKSSECNLITKRCFRVFVPVSKTLRVKQNNLSISNQPQVPDSKLIVHPASSVVENSLNSPVRENVQNEEESKNEVQPAVLSSSESLKSDSKSMCESAIITPSTDEESAAAKDGDSSILNESVACDPKHDAEPVISPQLSLLNVPAIEQAKVPEPVSEPVKEDKVTKFPTWANRDALCWLNAAMGFLLHNNTLKRFYSEQNHAKCQINQLFAMYNDIITKMNSSDFVEADMIQVKEKLYLMQESTFSFLATNQGCVKGVPDMPLHALVLLLKECSAIKELFEFKHFVKFSCKNCLQFKCPRSVSKTVTTFCKIDENFSMTSPSYITSCLKCKTCNNQVIVEIEKLPESLICRFQNGLCVPSVTSLDFDWMGQKYEVSSVIQYTTVQSKAHFITWARDRTNEHWMNCDDLQTVPQVFKKQVPNWKASEVHLVMFERVHDNESMQCTNNHQKENLSNTEFQSVPVSVETSEVKGKVHQKPKNAIQHLIVPADQLYPSENKDVETSMDDTSSNVPAVNFFLPVIHSKFDTFLPKGLNIPAVKQRITGKTKTQHVTKSTDENLNDIATPNVETCHAKSPLKMNHGQKSSNGSACSISVTEKSVVAQINETKCGDSELESAPKRKAKENCIESKTKKGKLNKKQEVNKSLVCTSETGIDAKVQQKNDKTVLQDGLVIPLTEKQKNNSTVGESRLDNVTTSVPNSPRCRRMKSFPRKIISTSTAPIQMSKLSIAQKGMLKESEPSPNTVTPVKLAKSKNLTVELNENSDTNSDVLEHKKLRAVNKPKSDTSFTKPDDSKSCVQKPYVPVTSNASAISESSRIDNTKAGDFNDINKLHEPILSKPKGRPQKSPKNTKSQGSNSKKILPKAKRVVLFKPEAPTSEISISGKETSVKQYEKPKVPVHNDVDLIDKHDISTNIVDKNSHLNEITEDSTLDLSKDTKCLTDTDGHLGTGLFDTLDEFAQESIDSLNQFTEELFGVTSQQNSIANSQLDDHDCSTYPHLNPNCRTYLSNPSERKKKRSRTGRLLNSPKCTQSPEQDSSLKSKFKTPANRKRKSRRKSSYDKFSLSIDSIDKESVQLDLEMIRLTSDFQRFESLKSTRLSSIALAENKLKVCKKMANNQLQKLKLQKLKEPAKCKTDSSEVNYSVSKKSAGKFEKPKRVRAAKQLVTQASQKSSLLISEAVSAYQELTMSEYKSTLASTPANKAVNTPSPTVSPICQSQPSSKNLVRSLPCSSSEKEVVASPKKGGMKKRKAGNEINDVEHVPKRKKNVRFVEPNKSFPEVPNVGAVSDGKRVVGDVHDHGVINTIPSHMKRKVLNYAVSKDSSPSVENEVRKIILTPTLNDHDGHQVVGVLINRKTEGMKSKEAKQLDRVVESIKGTSVDEQNVVEGDGNVRPSVKSDSFQLQNCESKLLNPHVKTHVSDLATKQIILSPFIKELLSRQQLKVESLPNQASNTTKMKGTRPTTPLSTRRNRTKNISSDQSRMTFSSPSYMKKAETTTIIAVPSSSQRATFNCDVKSRVQFSDDRKVNKEALNSVVCEDSTVKDEDCEEKSKVIDASAAYNELFKQLVYKNSPKKQTSPTKISPLRVKWGNEKKRNPKACVKRKTASLSPEKQSFQIADDVSSCKQIKLNDNAHVEHSDVKNHNLQNSVPICDVPSKKSPKLENQKEATKFENLNLKDENRQSTTLEESDEHSIRPSSQNRKSYSRIKMLDNSEVFDNASAVEHSVDTPAMKHSACLSQEHGAVTNSSVDGRVTKINVFTTNKELKSTEGSKTVVVDDKKNVQTLNTVQNVLPTSPSQNEEQGVPGNKQRITLLPKIEKKKKQNRNSYSRIKMLDNSEVFDNASAVEHSVDTPTMKRSACLSQEHGAVTNSSVDGRVTKINVFTTNKELKSTEGSKTVVVDDKKNVQTLNTVQNVLPTSPSQNEEQGVPGNKQRITLLPKIEKKKKQNRNSYSRIKMLDNSEVFDNASAVEHSVDTPTMKHSACLSQEHGAVTNSSVDGKVTKINVFTTNKELKSTEGSKTVVVDDKKNVQTLNTVQNVLPTSPSQNEEQGVPGNKQKITLLPEQLKLLSTALAALTRVNAKFVASSSNKNVPSSSSQKTNQSPVQIFVQNSPLSVTVVPKRVDITAPETTITVTPSKAPTVKKPSSHDSHKTKTGRMKKVHRSRPASKVRKVMNGKRSRCKQEVESDDSKSVQTSEKSADSPASLRRSARKVKPPKWHPLSEEQQSDIPSGEDDDDIDQDYQPLKAKRNKQVIMSSTDEDSELEYFNGPAQIKRPLVRKSRGRKSQRNSPHHVQEKLSPSKAPLSSSPSKAPLSSSPSKAPLSSPSKAPLSLSPSKAPLSSSPSRPAGFFITYSKKLPDSSE